VAAKTEKIGRRYVGMLTDGVDWLCYNLVQEELREVSAVTVKEGKAELDRLVFWLEGVLATAKGIKPSANEITSRLGARSSAYALDRATLSHLYQLNRKLPTLQMKRKLWSRLLTSALGTQFEDTDDLFIEPRSSSIPPKSSHTPSSKASIPPPFSPARSLMKAGSTVLSNLISSIGFWRLMAERNLFAPLPVV
jgi:hypothetical protein